MAASSPAAATSSLRIWNQNGKQLGKPNPSANSPSASRIPTNRTARSRPVGRVVQVYRRQAAKQGSLVTNPPTLDERLAVAKKMLQEKTNKLHRCRSGHRKAESKPPQPILSHRRATKMAALKSESEKLAAEMKQINDSRAAKDAEKPKPQAACKSRPPAPRLPKPSAI